ncbi:hypothetical protein AK812_SmicGene1191 [Symbiodinium microadriaticum]|uniref:Uncharacterized protein n=1 Tax=Symbiodinium microadriaticum TaxID=2951 RepID=A0A1Q9F4T5_SYMMI|nr:hypothetical protein AK812_SmicGene1191 [Symbiodinium microadriaticum]
MVLRVDQHWPREPPPAKPDAKQDRTSSRRGFDQKKSARHPTHEHECFMGAALRHGPAETMTRRSVHLPGRLVLAENELPDAKFTSGRDVEQI